MELTEKELVEEIKKALVFEECTYRDGAWEKFNVKQRKKWSAYRCIKVLSIAVLVFLIILGLLYFPVLVNCYAMIKDLFL